MCRSHVRRQKCHPGMHVCSLNLTQIKGVHNLHKLPFFDKTTTMNHNGRDHPSFEENILMRLKGLVFSALHLRYLGGCSISPRVDMTPFFNELPSTEFTHREGPQQFALEGTLIPLIRRFLVGKSTLLPSSSEKFAPKVGVLFGFVNRNLLI